jgi:hypothetical protein
VIFLCNKFHKNPPQGLGGVAKKRLKRRTDWRQRYSIIRPHFWMCTIIAILCKDWKNKMVYDIIFFVYFNIPDPIYMLSTMYRYFFISHGFQIKRYWNASNREWLHKLEFAVFIPNLHGDRYWN